VRGVSVKRYLVFPLDFDSRAYFLKEPEENWDGKVKEIHLENQKTLKERIKAEFGELNFDQKLENFMGAGDAPFSIISYHNQLYKQARSAFICGLYYPALTALCALGERIINHLIIDLREKYKYTKYYKYVYRNKSFDDWSYAINILVEWGVFQHQDVEKEFHKLKDIRMRSLHFNPDTYKNLRSDALSALTHLGNIISMQFGFASNQKWIIHGTQGAFFIKKEAEQHPFMARYYLPQCPLVGPYYAAHHTERGQWLFFDWNNYDEREITDEEFSSLYTNRTLGQLVPNVIPFESNVSVQTSVVSLNS